MSTKEIQESLEKSMQHWQQLENAAIAATGKIMMKTSNPVIRQVMEIIQQDSGMHYRIQKLIELSLTETQLNMSVDELADIWDLIEEHIKLEKKTIDVAKESLEALEGKHMVIQEYLLHYLLMDEEKHDAMLESLSKIKKGMYPYGG